MDRNKHVKDYLAYYITFPHPPRFAVLLNGPWGIGKTFLLKAFLKPYSTEDWKYVYVSLYGLASLDEIDDALLRDMYPALEWKTTKVASRVLKAGLKYLKVDLNLEPRDIANKLNAYLYVFDDLERCALPINKVLGYINEFVEHND